MDMFPEKTEIREKAKTDFVFKGLHVRQAARSCCAGSRSEIGNALMTDFEAHRNNRKARALPVYIARVIVLIGVAALVDHRRCPS